MTTTRLRLCTLLATAIAAALTACGNPANTIRLGAKTATIGTLYALKADRAETATVRSIAIDVRDITTSSGTIDLESLRLMILKRIEEQFSGQAEILVLAAADEIIQLVIAELATFETPPALSTIIVWVNAAATGVVQGCELYDVTIEEPPLATMAAPIFTVSIVVRRPAA